MKVLCPSDIRKYNQFMNGPDWCDEKKVTLEFDGRSKFRFYLQVFFNFLDIAFVNSKISYHKIVSTPALSTIQLDSRQSIAQKMIFNFPSRKRAIPTFRPTKRSIGESFGIANCLPDLPPLELIVRYVQDKKLNTFRCVSCSVPLCLQRKNNWF